MSIIGEQVKEGRKLLGWKRTVLARAAGVSQSTVYTFERGTIQPSGWVLTVLRTALEAAGVEFTNGGQPGVRMKVKLPAISDEAAIGDDPEAKNPT